MNPATLELDLGRLTVREVNAALKKLPPGARARVSGAAGQHSLGVGLDAAIDVVIDGPAGYYTGGLAKHASITVEGSVGWGVGENLMSGTVRVHGNASQSAAASAHGGLVVVEGNASLRAGISLKGARLAIAGDVGAYCGFLAQAGTILIGGNAGPGLGDSLYEAVIYVAGSIAELGTDARVEDLTEADVAAVKRLCAEAGFDHIDPAKVSRVASAKQLYHFSTHHAGSY